MLRSITFLHFFTTACIVEMIFLFLFRFTRSPLSGRAINQWYTNLRWSAVILDILSLLIGFYIAKFIYEYLVAKGYLTTKYELGKFLGIVLMVQIIHDFSFYAFVIQPTPMGQSLVLDEFKRYAKAIGTGAVIGDSILYLVATPLLFYLATLRQDINVFSSLVSLYLIGYFVYQKPLV